MIKLNRIKKPDYLDDQKVLDETEEAKKLFDPAVNETTSLKDKKKKFKYSRYRDDRVKDALKEMCNNKCAYCESTFLHVYYGDIEHFRPKKFVGTKSDPRVPGYYWLANDWDNLLLSCLFCNQAKKNEVVQNGQLVEITIGKQNQFPLNNQVLYDTPRAHQTWSNGGSTADEGARLIIDPCKDDPEKHLQYHKEGMVLPKKIKQGGQDIDDPKGAKSIEVFALQRIYLVQERKKRLIDLELQLTTTREVFKKLNDTNFNSNPVIASYYTDRLKVEVDKLFHFTHRLMNYSAMCRQFVYAFLEDELNKTKAAIRNAEKKVHEKMDA